MQEQNKGEIQKHVVVRQDYKRGTEKKIYDMKHWFQKLIKKNIEDQKFLEKLNK